MLNFGRDICQFQTYLVIYIYIYRYRIIKHHPNKPLMIHGHTGVVFSFYPHFFPFPLGKWWTPPILPSFPYLSKCLKCLVKFKKKHLLNYHTFRHILSFAITSSFDPFLFLPEKNTKALCNACTKGRSWQSAITLPVQDLGANSGCS